MFKIWKEISAFYGQEEKAEPAILVRRRKGSKGGGQCGMIEGTRRICHYDVNSWLCFNHILDVGRIKNFKNFN